jgi:hypothetical protein
LLAFVPTSARAFTSCSRTTFATAAASVPEEGEDPAVYGRNVYAAYTDASGLILRASHDFGGSWASFVLDPDGILPRIVASGNRVYVAWVTRTVSKSSVKLLRSMDDGASFVGQTDLGPFFADFADELSLGDSEIQVAVSGALVAVSAIADRNHVAVAVSTDHGRTFSRTLLPTFGVDPGEEVIAALGSEIAAVWNDIGADGLFKILVSTSTDAGASFSPPQNLTPDGVDAREPLLSASQSTGALYMTWREARTGFGSSVGFLGKSGDFGVTWSRRVIDPGVNRARQFSVAAVDPNVYVAYLRHRATGDWWTQLRVSHDSAASFGLPVALGNTGLTGMLSDETHAPRMWARDDLFRIVFDVEGSLYIRSSADGGTRLAPKLRLGRGTAALVAQNTVLWLSETGAVRFARCR